MIARSGSGWQYILADLSLILFMVTAAALASADDAPAAAKAAPAPKRPDLSGGGQPLSPQGEPLALYRAAPGAPPLGQWLRDQSADARQQLTIVAQYRPGAQADALTQAETLARQAGEAGTRARIVVEPGQGGTSAALAFDSPLGGTIDAAVARKLQEPGRKP
jgi:hypothetical protein